MRPSLLLATVGFAAAPLSLAAQQPGAVPSAPSLDTVRVVSRTAAALAAPSRAVDVIERSALERISGRTLGELLMQRLGVDLLTRSPAQADLQMRGASFNQVLVLVDGARVSDAQTGHHSLNLALPLVEI